jgi:hypothetical protein
MPWVPQAPLDNEPQGGGLEAALSLIFSVVGSILGVLFQVLIKTFEVILTGMRRR